MNPKTICISLNQFSDVYDVVLVLRSQKAVDGFKGMANLTLGAESELVDLLLKI